MRKSNVALLLVMLFLFANNVFAERKPYEVKSGVIEMEVTTNMNGKEMVSNSSMYFTDYGKKMATRTKSDTNVMGMKQVSDVSMIMLSDRSYMVNHIDKNYITYMDDEEDEDDSDDEDYTDSMMDKPVGKEKIAGKMCDIYESSETDSDGGKSSYKIWIWKGLVLKQETSYDMPGYKTTTVSLAKKVDLKNVSKKEFEIPKGYKPNEEAMNAMKAFEDMQDNMDKMMEENMTEEEKAQRAWEEEEQRKFEEEERKWEEKEAQENNDDSSDDSDDEMDAKQLMKGLKSLFGN